MFRSLFPGVGVGGDGGGGGDGGSAGDGGEIANAAKNYAKQDGDGGGGRSVIGVKTIAKNLLDPGKGLIDNLVSFNVFIKNKRSPNNVNEVVIIIKWSMYIRL